MLAVSALEVTATAGSTGSSPTLVASPEGRRSGVEVRAVGPDAGVVEQSRQSQAHVVEPALCGLQTLGMICCLRLRAR